MRLSNIDPSLNRVQLSPGEAEARKITAESFEQWGESVDIADQTAPQVAEVIVGIAHTAFIAGKAEGLMARQGQDVAHEAYLQGIEDGKRIERERRGD